MENEIICPQCNNQYKDQCPPRILTMCGHTFCEKCISSMISKPQQQKENYIIKCPEDDSWMNLINLNFSIFPKNIALLKLIELKKNNIPFKQQSLNISKIVKQEEGIQDDDANQLISAMREGKQSFSRSYDKQDKISVSNSTEQIGIGYSLNITSATQYKAQLAEDNTNSACDGDSPALILDNATIIQGNNSFKNGQKFEQEADLCLLHQKPLQIVCINEGIKICSKCAIFGQHKGHQFKTIQQIQNESNNYYSSLLNIFQHKNNINDKISSKQTQHDLLAILNTKTSLIKKQIKQAFKKIILQLQNCESQCENQLQKIRSKSQQEIKQLLVLSQSNLTKFKLWEKQSYKDLTILESSKLQDKIKLLYEFDIKKQAKTDQILSKGNLLIQQFKKQQDNLVQKVQNILEKIYFYCDSSFSQNLSSYFKVFDSNNKSSKPKQQGVKQCKISKQKQKKTTKTNIIQKSRGKYQGQITNLSGIKELDDIHLSNSPLNQQSLLEFEHEDAENKFDNNDKFVSQPFLYKESRPSLLKQSIFVQEFCQLKLQSKQQLQLFQTPLKINQQIKRKDITSSKMMTQRPSISFKDTSFCNDNKGERPNKKKLKSIKVPQKFQKILQNVYNDATDLIDLTNAQLGDQTVGQICEFIKFGKARSLKLIRNKLTDQGIGKAISCFSSIVTLNLSQNNLTERVLDLFFQARQSLPNLKNLILSQNKIIQRKHKERIQKLRKLNITVSV